MQHHLSDSEKTKLVELRRVKLLATGVLVLCFLVMIGANMLEARWPAMAFLAAFAEAATIGGIADWYAVVALFKRPLNLPIPHTAIIPANQERIGDNLGRFIESNFLSKETVGAKLKEVRFADEISAWLSDETKSQELARFVAKLMPQLLDAIDHSGVREFAAQRVKEQLQQTEVAPMATKLLDAFVKDGRHHKLMDDLISALHKFLSDEVAQETIRQRVQKELPSLLYIFQAEGMILRRVIKAASSLLDEIRDDPDHPLRDEFEKFLVDYVKQIKRSKRFASRVESMKGDILARPEFSGIADRLWNTITEFLREDVTKPNSATVKRLSDLFVDAGQNLHNADDLKTEIDAELSRIFAALVEAQKSSVSAFISGQVKSWDFAQLTLLIEANIGKDLQYIRFNGMIIGGFAGLTLHVITQMIT